MFKRNSFLPTKLEVFIRWWNSVRSQSPKQHDYVHTTISSFVFLDGAQDTTKFGEKRHSRWSWGIEKGKMYVVEKILYFVSGSHQTMFLISNLASPLFVKKGLLGHSHHICLYIVYNGFYIIATESSSCGSDQISCKAWSIFYPLIYRKFSDLSPR